MNTVHIQNKDNPLAQPLQAGYCASFLCRLRGLMFRNNLAPHEGLLLVQKRASRMDASIHMLFVFMDLGVVWINGDGQVVDTILARAWRPAYTPKAAAQYILEINPDRLTDFRIGEQVEFIHDQTHLP